MYMYAYILISLFLHCLCGPRRLCHWQQPGDVAIAVLCAGSDRYQTGRLHGCRARTVNTKRRPRLKLPGRAMDRWSCLTASMTARLSCLSPLERRFQLREDFKLFSFCSFSSSAAYSSARPLCFTASRTTSLSPFSSSAANASALPFSFTAFRTTSLSPFSSSAAYRNAQPLCFTASRTTYLSPFSSSAAP